MNATLDDFFEAGTYDEEVAVAKNLAASDLLDAAAGYNWDGCPERTLKAIVQRPDCSLVAALLIFCMGDPGYYEEMLDADLSSHSLENLEMLNYIHDRVNAGQYQHIAGQRDNWIKDELPNFVLPRTRKSSAIKQQRWGFDAALVAPALKPIVPDPNAPIKSSVEIRDMLNNNQYDFKKLISLVKANRK